LLATASTAAEQSPERTVLLRGETGGAAPTFADAERADERRLMVDEQIAGRGLSDEAVLAAMRQVPRHRFLSRDRRERAYHDRPLPIGHGQTISQPYIVARMTTLLDLDADARVLEVGTGSGYHAAVVAQLVDELVTIEIIRPLAERAASRLDRQGYGNVTVIHGDGYYGYPEAAPFDGIVVTAAAGHVPPPLIDQLVRGGRMVIPVERSGWAQNLLLVRKNADGEIRTERLMPVRFVPLTGAH
jgi:protein-L-isoaspartate(D-aspartate) O-methyltransferase